MARTKQFALASSLGAAVLATVIAGCGSTGSGNSTAAVKNGKGCKKIGILLPETNSSPRWDGYDKPDLEKYISQSVPGATYTYANANGSASTQQSQAQSALTNGACILVVAPSDLNASAAIVALAKQQNVPVIAYDRLINSPDLSYYVSYDNVAVGKLQGQYISDNYQNYVVNGKTPNMTMINGSPTDNNATLFKQGAHDILDPLVQGGKINLVYEQSTPNWDPPTAQNEEQAALTKANNDVQIAYSANDDMAGTIIAALQQVGLDKPGGQKVLVTGQDATVPGLQRVLEGTQSMTVFKQYSNEAQAAAQLVTDISEGKDTSSLVNGSTTTPGGASIKSVLETPKAITSSNVSDVVASGQVTKDQICSGIPSGTNTNGFCS